MATETITYRVPGMSCGHCRVAVTEEVTVTGAELDDAKLRSAIDEAGYEAA